MNIVELVLSVFTAIAGWFVETITAITPIFYVAETGLTIIGVLSLCGLGVGIILLVINLVRRFFNFA